MLSQSSLAVSTSDTTLISLLFPLFLYFLLLLLLLCRLQATSVVILVVVGAPEPVQVVRVVQQHLTTQG